MAAIRIEQIVIEHYESGFGINHSKPRISWTYTSSNDTKDFTQQSYDVEIRASSGRLAAGNDSEVKVLKYHIEGDNSIMRPWPGAALSSRQRVEVRVQSHGEALSDSESSGSSRKKISSEWSDWTPIEVGLLKQEDWTARPVSDGNAGVDLKSSIRPIRIRKTFELSGIAVDYARLYITAYGVYEAYLNGRRIGDHYLAPGWTSYAHRLQYQVHDVTDLLSHSRPNILTVEVAEGWYAGRMGYYGGRRFVWGNQLAVLAQLEVFSEESETPFVLSSDESWKWTQSALTQSEIYDGETYDAAQESGDWHAGSFDDSSWKSAVELDAPKAQLIASEAPPVRITETIKPVDVIKSRSGKTIMDFGRNIVGWLHIKRIKSSGDGAQQITLTHTEVIENGEVATRPLRHAKCIDIIHVGKNDVIDWSPKFTFHGFRYVQVEVEGQQDLPFSIEDDVQAQVLHTDMHATGSFECSEPLINKLHLNTIWSMRGNFLAVPTDCPQRDERLGWTGDYAIFAPTAHFLYDTFGTLSNWLTDVYDEHVDPARNGIPPIVVPNVLHESVQGNVAVLPQGVWGDVVVLGPWQLYEACGDIEILSRHFPSMKLWLERGVMRGSDGLWEESLWQFADWLDPAAPPHDPSAGRTDPTFVCDTYLINSYRIVAEVAELICLPEEARHWKVEYHKHKHIFQSKYISSTGRLVSDTQTAYALVINFGLFQNDQQLRTAAARLALLIHRAKFHIDTGFCGTPAILPALTTIGETQLAYRMLEGRECPSWLYPITMGATTMWERWDSMLPDGTINPGEMTSFNHYALGSVCAWLHEGVGGLSLVEPGWRRFRVKPVPGGTIKWADVRYKSASGVIRCKWSIDKEPGQFWMEVDVPPNTKALICLPETNADNFAETDANKRSTKGEWVGSGHHEYSCPYKASEWPPPSKQLRDFPVG